MVYCLDFNFSQTNFNFFPNDYFISVMTIKIKTLVTISITHILTLLDLQEQHSNTHTLFSIFFFCYQKTDKYTVT